MSAGTDKEKNIKTAEKMAREARGKGAKVIILPEMFNCPYDSLYFTPFSEPEGGPTFMRLSALAKELGVYIIGGSIPEKDGGKIYNTSYSFDKNGNLVGKHRKAHLFDIDIPGKITFKESELLSAGEGATVIDTEYGKLGIAICFDIRFPEFIRTMVLKGAKLCIIPAAFNMTTGPAHWHLTARARAVDNQIYFALCSPARNMSASYVAYGHSLIADPWGEIMAEIGEEKGICYGDIDLDYVDKVREDLPLLKLRKPSLYEI